jgi:hypothetical protein
MLACSGSRPPNRNELSPGIVFPTAFGEGHGDGADTPMTPTAPASAAAPAPSPQAPEHGGLPDPEPLRLADQWEYELEWKRGKLSVISATPKRFATPVVTARRMGRFAIELWIGSELIDRVRFDFPMLAVEEPKAAVGATSLAQPPSLEKGVEVRQKVLVPASPRARQALLLDRATSARQVLAWPPEPGPASTSSK